MNKLLVTIVLSFSVFFSVQPMEKTSSSPTRKRRLEEVSEKPEVSVSNKQKRAPGSLVKQIIDGCTLKRLLQTVSELGDLYSNSLAANTWLTEKPDQVFLDKERSTGHYKPYFEKLVLDKETAAKKKVFVFADLHGDIESLAQMLEKFESDDLLFIDHEQNVTITDPDLLFIFTGDYVDRGQHGAEVLNTVYNLKVKNPNNVILTRGNHEEMAQNQGEGNFVSELCAKYKLKPFENSNHKDKLKKIFASYKFLPSAFFLGVRENGHTNFLKFCHGGFDAGSNPYLFLRNDAFTHMLITKLMRYNTLRNIGLKNPELAKKINLDDLEKQFPNHIKNIEQFSDSDWEGFGEVWGDFNFNPEDQSLLIDGGRGEQSVACNKELVKILCQEASSKDCTLVATIRGHQHNEDTMPKIVNHGGVHCLGCDQLAKETTLVLQQGDVITLAPSPDSIYGQGFGYTYLAYANIDLVKFELKKCQLPIKTTQAQITATSSSTQPEQAEDLPDLHCYEKAL